MILELDCGNTLIKWRVLPGAAEAPKYAGHADADADLAAQLDALPDLKLQWCRIVSVRSNEETQRLLELLGSRHCLEILQAAPTQFCAGVSNGYDDYRRLGLDRWMAVLGGYHLQRKACLIVDLGTAITADFVSADGKHLGGYICPGLPLMREQLRIHTRRIRYDAASSAEASSDLLPGRNTAEAVERGCQLMIRGFVEAQCRQAGEILGADFALYLTGGDAARVGNVWPGAMVVADLVFRGLAIACPIEGG